MAETFDNLTDHVSNICWPKTPFLFCFRAFAFSYSKRLSVCYAQVKIAMVGKYVGLTDSYLSVVKVNLTLVFYRIEFG